MKSITYFILLILIVSISTDTQTCEDITPSKDNCKAYTSLTAEEKEYGDSCCYVAYDSASASNGKFEDCEIVVKADVEKAVKNAKSAGYKGVTYVCSSNWLNLGLSFLLLVLFF